jgi:hypothetical protein
MPGTKKYHPEQLGLFPSERPPEPDRKPVLEERQRLAELWRSKHPNDNREKGEQGPFPSAGD